MSLFESFNLDEKSVRITQPDNIIIPLKEHQKAIIYYARKLEELKPFKIKENKQMITQMGVICDKVGSGKSFEILGIIASSISLDNEIKLHSFTDLKQYKIYNPNNFKKIDTNIIVVPHGIFKQWEEYIYKFTKLSCYSIINFQSLKNLIKNYKLDELYDDDDEIEEPLIDNLLNNWEKLISSLQTEPKKPTKSTTRSTTRTTTTILKGKTSKKSKENESLDDENLELSDTDFHKKSKKIRDTKYYRYLQPYYKQNLEIESILNQYGYLDLNKINHNILLISASIYNEFSFYMNKDNYYVNRLIFDEADSINIQNTQKINSLFYWFITSSYESLNSPDGIQKTIKITLNNREIEKMIKENGIKCEGFIKQTFKQIEFDENKMYYFIKNNDNFIDISFKLPAIIELLILCKDNLQISILNGVVSNDILRMINAGDTETVIKHLSCEKGSLENIIDVITQKLNQKIIDFKQELIDKETKEYINPKAKEEALERTHSKIKDTKEKIKMIEDRIKDVDCCIVCMDTINNPSVVNCCQNVFCFSCLVTWISIKNNCPNCRESLSIDKILIIKDAEKEKKDMEVKEKEQKELLEKEKKNNTPEKKLQFILDNSILNDKYTNLERILEYKMKYFTKEQRKILIFSEYEGSFNPKLLNILDKFKIRYSRVKGSAVSINKIIHDYKGDYKGDSKGDYKSNSSSKKNDEEIDVLLINSRYFGAGLNLENSSDIIILHKQGVDLLHQVIGRAQRLGRKFPLNVWKLYYKNENTS
jgi:hypothetical protein